MDKGSEELAMTKVTLEEHEKGTVHPHDGSRDNLVALAMNWYECSVNGHVKQRRETYM